MTALSCSTQTTTNAVVTSRGHGKLGENGDPFVPGLPRVLSSRAPQHLDNERALCYWSSLADALRIILMVVCGGLGLHHDAYGGSAVELHLHLHRHTWARYTLSMAGAIALLCARAGSGRYPSRGACAAPDSFIINVAVLPALRRFSLVFAFMASSLVSVLSQGS